MRPDETFKAISDTVIGPNLRLRDNLIQGAVVLIGTVVGALVGAALAEERLFGATLGALAGMILSLFVSGFALMIYRAVAHARGQHD